MNGECSGWLNFSWVYRDQEWEEGNYCIYTLALSKSRHLNTRVAEPENFKTVPVPTFYLITVPVPAPVPVPVPAPVPAPVPGHIHAYTYTYTYVYVYVFVNIYIYIC